MDDPKQLLRDNLLDVWEEMPDTDSISGLGNLTFGHIRAVYARIEALEQHVSALEEALRQADEAMTCRRDDDAHYCPNCDNSLYEARGKIRAALNREPNP